eukprot:scaffold759_cov119-Isochrysis_galbana.AAC.3
MAACHGSRGDLNGEGGEKGRDFLPVRQAATSAAATAACARPAPVQRAAPQRSEPCFLLPQRMSEREAQMSAMCTTETTIFNSSRKSGKRPSGMVRSATATVSRALGRPPATPFRPLLCPPPPTIPALCPADSAALRRGLRRAAPRLAQQQHRGGAARLSFGTVIAALIPQRQGWRRGVGVERVGLSDQHIGRLVGGWREPGPRVLARRRLPHPARDLRAVCSGGGRRVRLHVR